MVSLVGGNPVNSDVRRLIMGGKKMVTEKQNPPLKHVCGIIMPISAIDDCTAEHWADVLSILREVIESAGFEPNLVSDADDIGIIQKRIIQNVYSNEILVCDVSGKNPNVMFELGLRLAFDKPTIIIKDGHTNYTFDTSVIEHLEYPRDLRFTKIVEFKEKLKSKLIATHKKSLSDPNYSTFLKSFGEYTVAHLERKEISSDAYILESLEEVKQEMRSMRQQSNRELFVEQRPPRPVVPHDCIPDHIIEYAAEHNFLMTSELRKRQTQLVDFLASIDHTGSDVSSVVKHTLNSAEFRRRLAKLRSERSKSTTSGNGNK